MLKASNLWDLIEKRADTTPDATFLINETGDTVTFAAYRDRVERVAAGLIEVAGISEGMVVSWQLPTWIESVVVVSALSRIGALQNPLVPIYREKEVGFICGQLDSDALIVPGEWRGFDYTAMAETIAAGADALRVITFDGDLPEADPADLPAAPGTGDDIGWYFYTSGTTSEPKGARHTDQSVMHSGLVNADAVEMDASDVVLLVFPFTHIGGISIMCSALMTGAAIALVEAFAPDTTAEAIKRAGVTIGSGATPIHQAFLAVERSRPDDDLFATVRVWPSGGAPIPPALHFEMKGVGTPDNAGIVSGYGLTESPILTMNRLGDDDELKANTEGRPTVGVELRLVTLDDKIAGIGEEGEIRAKAPQLMQGYVNSSLNGDAFDDDGWFRTGDLGHQDANGYVTITGRLKDVIIRKGENISALEVENLLYEHPKVTEVAVIGLPDADLGERCCAVVALDAQADGTLEFGEMVAFCKEKGLMNQKIPEQLEIVDALPRNNTGKVLKHVLQSEYK